MTFQQHRSGINCYSLKIAHPQQPNLTSIRETLCAQHRYDHHLLLQTQPSSESYLLLLWTTMFPLLLLLLTFIHAAPMMNRHFRPMHSQQRVFLREASAGNTNEVLRLIIAGFDVNHPDSYGFTALISAVKGGIWIQLNN